MAKLNAYRQNISDLETMSSQPTQIPRKPCKLGLNVQSNIVSPHSYNNYLIMHQHMNMNQEFDILPSTESHHYCNQPYSTYGEIEFLMDRSGIETDYMFYEPDFQMEEILKNFAYDSPIKIGSTCQTEKVIGDKTPLEKIQKLQQRECLKKQKKIKKGENSPFHNYQKHLNNALKKLIIVPEFEPQDGQQKLAAIQIWKAYCKCEIKTKRILHFIFNQRNEHSINDSELRTYGLFNIYQKFGEEVISQARTYLSKLAIDQIDPQNVEGYLKFRKLKSKDGFGEYILAFKAELESGYLKRRINVDK